jgi:hypothetical protein
MSYGSNLVLEETSVGCQFMNMQLIWEEIYVVVCTFGLLSQDVIPFPPFVIKGRIKLSYAGIPGNRFPKSQKVFKYIFCVLQLGKAAKVN